MVNVASVRCRMGWVWSGLCRRQLRSSRSEAQLIGELVRMFSERADAARLLSRCRSNNKERICVIRESMLFDWRWS